MRVLLVDDEPMVLTSTSRLLVNLGYETRAVDRADRILDAIREWRPDAVLQDLHMPGLDLARLVREIRADEATRRTPVVLCSAALDVADVARALGVDGCLEKPYRPQDMLDVLQALGPRAPAL